MKINKTNKHSAKDDKDSNTSRTKKAGMNLSAIEGYAFPVSYKVLTVLLMNNSATSWHELQHVVVILWLLDLQLAVQSVHITTKGTRSKPANGDVYSI
jgi:hypothetical protein